MLPLLGGRFVGESAIERLVPARGEGLPSRALGLAYDDLRARHFTDFCAARFAAGRLVGRARAPRARRRPLVPGAGGGRGLPTAMETPCRFHPWHCGAAIAGARLSHAVPSPTAGAASTTYPPFGPRPNAPGVSATVQDRDDRLQVRNTGRATVTIFGYNREPYARIEPGAGTGQPALAGAVPERGPLRQGRRAREASARAPPVWKTLDNTGAFDWHDHRIHWMVKDRPGKVTDPDARTKVFDWKVPVRVDGRPADIRGDLYWVPKPGSSFPVAAGIALAR